MGDALRGPQMAAHPREEGDNPETEMISPAEAQRRREEEAANEALTLGMIGLFLINLCATAPLRESLPFHVPIYDNAETANSLDYLSTLP